ncbi:bifunctional DNA-formamidopyrimidine glycosylase/DNA-(apurinic or apyrimidinic site) lyase [Hyphomicrobium sp.]|jgi:formamidopyrimidine-DNA glycosylase|uniref:bifunctional DNA-formamidopyrimidine glycosylase/DNA-(apurinic or apyrimidinic site) lyase n=1 Tax=Hyphomicrobium sp. TaxID=82 RepID=UPI002BD7168B|nr:bifunctional DNA-formamidopyrimidine glycosylase/DNA-(apurinic or apyrimidinic site) lyase [Hyphomicrobium sp.]HVZ05887.1 bifunctional DNA-formamidopyrimidine glycosylase/DNA-(apurinic or apyrimidinic site) lyase [Hyphomicrobium sp.]
MPELPEVETVRRGLAPVVVGRRITDVETRRPDLRFPFPERFFERLVGQKVVSLDRRAKYLIAGLSSGEDLVMHLGMTGRFTIVQHGHRETPGEYTNTVGPNPAHDHLLLRLSNGSRIVYNDPRRFGFMVMMPHAERAQHPLFRGLGVEPLSPELAPQYLARRAQGKKVNLKAFLMDQRIVAGLGNIYVSEALFWARLSPNRAARTLADRRGAPTEPAKRLVPAIREVLELAINAGGSTLRDYRDANGVSGGFQHRFAVYDRAGQPCPRPGCGGTIRRAVHAGRATFYCPRCQR